MAPEETVSKRKGSRRQVRLHDSWSHGVLGQFSRFLVLLVVGHVVGWSLVPYFLLWSNDTQTKASFDPSYSPRQFRVCQPPYVRERPGVPRASNLCVVVENVTENSFSAIFVVPEGIASVNGDSTIEVGLAASGRVHSPRRGIERAQVGYNVSSFEYKVGGLLLDSDYIITAAVIDGVNGARQEFCRGTLSTLAQNGNQVRNPSFEDPGGSPLLASRYFNGERSGANGWTPFYNGGMRLACGVLPCDSRHGDCLARRIVSQPRSGDCCALFGPGITNGNDIESEAVPKFYGAHQAVPLPGKPTGFVVTMWYSVWDGTPLHVTRDQSDSPTDSFALGVGWEGDDGHVVDPAFVDLGSDWESQARLAERQDRKWRRVCVVVSSSRRAISMSHVFIHFHDRPQGALLVDDVSVTVLNRSKGSLQEGWEREFPDCYLVANEKGDGKPIPEQRIHATGDVHLRAKQRPQPLQLTVVVPLTADRVLRLESLSRLYGGGPVAAAVLVRDEAEARMFHHVWKRRPWLQNHVDVSFLHMSRERVRRELIPINALRNTAVRLARTQFTLMLDVDMTPATESFDCFRDPSGSYLNGLVPADGTRIFTLPVFVTDVHVRSASNKQQLLNQLRHRVATSYCLNSQRSVKVDRWYSAGEPYETRFTTDYEPYGICRRDRHPVYDERFVGYGFNKISWAWGAEASGCRFFVLHDAFVTHLNHLDNDWVAHINVSLYLRTWRRYFAFVAESVANHRQTRQKVSFIPPRT